MNTPQFRFGKSEVDTATRQLTHAGRVVRAEPKVFDVLALLLRQRHRVVTKQELLDTVWGGRVVTDGVIARAIMKVRRLIGDDADPAVVQTVPRVGYRLVAEVEEVLAPPAVAQVPDGCPAAGACRIAVLPFVNGTGDPLYAWVALGLMSTTVDELVRHLGAAGVVPVGELLAALGEADTPPSLHATAARLGATLGAVEVLQGTLSRAEGGAPLALHFALAASTAADDGLATWRGVCEGAEPVTLSHRLAWRVAHRSHRATPEVQGLQPTADGRFAEAARARGLAALHEERWARAARLLVVALDQRPDDTVLQLAHAAARVGQGDPRAHAVVLAMLAEARQAGPAEQVRRALQLLAASHHRRGEPAQAETLLGEALRLAEAADDAEAELQVLLAGAQTLIGLDKPAVAAWMLDRADALATRVCRPEATARLLQARGRLALHRADSAAALGLFEAAVRHGERLAQQATAAQGLVHLGHVLRDLGRIGEARAAYERALHRAERTGDASLVGLCGVCAVRHAAPQDADAVRSRLHEAEALPGTIELAHAFALARRGELQPALAALDRAEQGMHHRPSFGLHHAVLRIRVLLALERLDDALEQCDALRARAAGRLQRPMLGASLHLRGVAAAIEGRERPALALLHESLRTQGASFARSEALLDAAWLHLRLGDVAEARGLLDEAAPFVHAAAASGHVPALQVRAAWQARSGATTTSPFGDGDARGLPSLSEFRLAPPAAVARAGAGEPALLGPR